VEAGTLNWATAEFPVPLCVEGDGFFVVLRPTTGASYESPGQGGGCGVGYYDTEGVHPCWITDDGENWATVSLECRLAVEVEITGDKSAGAVLLSEFMGAEIVNEEAVSSTISSNLLAVAPNPFNPLTEISYSLSSDGVVELRIYDAAGRKVRSLDQGFRSYGRHRVLWDGRNDSGMRLGSGVYFVKLTAGNDATTRSITLLK